MLGPSISHPVTSLSGNRTWVFSSIDSADSSGVGYKVEAGNLIVLTQV